MEDVRVLVVDDDRPIRRRIAALLAEGIGRSRVEEAASAEEAIERVASGSWDLIIMDIGLPGRSGLHALVDIRARHSVPVVIVTGRPADPYAAAAYAAGASAFVEKQHAMDDLLPTCVRLLAGEKLVGG